MNEYDDKATESTAYMVLKLTDQKTADELLDEMINEAQARSQVQAHRPENLPRQLEEEHSALVAQLVPSEIQWSRSEARMRYLDRYLNTYENHNDPEWQDAYQERWSEMVPGHPLFSEEDRQNLVRWAVKAAQGLPRIPEQPSAGSGLSEGQRRALQAAERRQAEQEHGMPHGYLEPPPESPSPSGICQHLRTTKQGSNPYLKQVKCRDCGEVLEKEKLAKTESMKTEDVANCEHEKKDYRGSTATTWKWTCQKCGHVKRGEKQPGQTARAAASTPTPSSVSPAPTTPLDDGSQADEIMNLVQHVLEVQRELGVPVSVQQLDKIYDKCKESVQRSHDRRSADRSRSARSTASKAASVAAPTPESWSSSYVSADPRLLDRDTLTSGVHRGRTYNDVYVNEATYTKSLIGKIKRCTLKDPELIKFAEYAEKRKEQSSGSEAYAVNFDIDPDDKVVAVLDTGCNNTCHGDR